jgi:hypothetical protein
MHYLDCLTSLAEFRTANLAELRAHLVPVHGSVTEHSTLHTLIPIAKTDWDHKADGERPTHGADGAYADVALAFARHTTRLEAHPAHIKDTMCEVDVDADALAGSDMHCIRCQMKPRCTSTEGFNCILHPSHSHCSECCTTLGDHTSCALHVCNSNGLVVLNLPYVQGCLPMRTRKKIL